jgi:hypothetical protein
MHPYFVLLLHLLTYTTAQYPDRPRCTINIVPYTSLNTTLFHTYIHTQQPIVFRQQQNHHRQQPHKPTSTTPPTTLKQHIRHAMHTDASLSIGSSKHWSTFRATGIASPSELTSQELLSAALVSPQDITALANIESMPVVASAFVQPVLPLTNDNDNVEEASVVLPPTTATTATTLLPSFLFDLFQTLHASVDLESAPLPSESMPAFTPAFTPTSSHSYTTGDNNASNATPLSWRTKIHASNAGSGVHFHREKMSFSYHVATGQVTWLTYPPSTLVPLEHTPRTSIHDWYTTRIYPILQQPNELPIECTTEPGDVIYIPEGWWQAYVVLEDDNKEPVFLVQSQLNHYDTLTERMRVQAKTLKTNKHYLAAYDAWDRLVKHTAYTDLTAMFQLSSVMSRSIVQQSMKRDATVAREIGLKKKVMLAMQNRTCDVLHSFGRTMLRAQNYMQARQLGRKCVGVCDQMSKCYELLSQGIEGVHGESTSVSVQAMDMAKEFVKRKKMTLAFEEKGVVLKFS